LSTQFEFHMILQQTTTEGRKLISTCIDFVQQLLVLVALLQEMRISVTPHVTSKNSFVALK